MGSVQNVNGTKITELAILAQCSAKIILSLGLAQVQIGMNVVYRVMAKQTARVDGICENAFLSLEKL